MSLLALTTNDGLIIIQDSKTFELLNELRCGSYVTSLCFSQDGTKLVSGLFDRNIKIWDVITGECLNILEGNNDYILSVDFNPDASRVVSYSKNGRIMIWNSDTGEFIFTIPSNSSFLQSVCFSPDGSKIITGKKGPMLKMWDSNTGDVIPTTEEFNGSRIMRHCFSGETGGSYI